MFQKLSLASIGIGILMMIMLFSGCAKYSPAFHSNKYYLKHKKTALKVYNWCNKTYKKNSLNEVLDKHRNRLINCDNAMAVVIDGN
jgi:hypothetical protein